MKGITLQELDDSLKSKIDEVETLSTELDSHLADNTASAHKAENIGLDSENFISFDVKGGMDELFTSVSNGKELIAAAIVDKKINTSGSDTFTGLAENIRKINTSRHDFKKITTYELMNRYGFDPLLAINLQTGGM